MKVQISKDMSLLLFKVLKSVLGGDINRIVNFFYLANKYMDLYQDFLLQGNSYTQHLIEHLVCKKDSSPQAFFLKDFPLRASSWLGYSSFYFNSLEVSDVKNQLFSPFEIKRIPLEKKLIREECAAPQSDKPLLVNRLGKELYGKHFGWAKSSDRVTIGELLKQHALYYNQEHCWVADNDFGIIERPEHITTEATLGYRPSSQSYAYTIRQTPYTVKVFNGLESGSYAFCYFLDWFCYY